MGIKYYPPREFTNVDALDLANDIVASAPVALNTLDELAAALNDDANFSSTVTNALATKVPYVQVTSDKAANYTIQASDRGSLIRSTSTAITITVPDVLQNGEQVDFLQGSSGQITFAGSGITINSADSKLKTAKIYAAATIKKVGGSYYLIGNLG